MRRLYKEFFYIPKQGKIREKVMMARVASTLAVIIICMIAMSVSAYAYFACENSSKKNVVQKAKFGIVAEVISTDEEMESPQISNGVYTFKLLPGKYSVSITNTGTATTGFVILTLTAQDTERVYHTQQIGKDIKNENNVPLKFSIDTTENLTVELKPHWGTSSHYAMYKTAAENTEDDSYITKDETIQIGTSAVTEVPDEEDTENQETSESESDQKTPDGNIEEKPAEEQQTEQEPEQGTEPEEEQKNEEDPVEEQPAKDEEPTEEQQTEEQNPTVDPDNQDPTDTTDTPADPGTTEDPLNPSETPTDPTNPTEPTQPEGEVTADPIEGEEEQQTIEEE